MIYINGLPLNVTMFPDNTSQVWKVKTLDIPGTNYVHIRWDFEHEGEFMHLAQLKHLIDRKGLSATLRVTYLPYGRQDKEVANDVTFALHTFNKYIDLMDWDEIIVMDPHSSVFKDKVRNVKVTYPIQEFKKVVFQTTATLICYPDGGAVQKYTSEYWDIVEDQFIHGEKIREQTTGNIISYNLIGSPKNDSVLVVDDICDGGATFVLLAKELYKAGAKEVNLFVTHGIFSKGLKPLQDAGIKRIFTAKGEVSEVQNNICYRSLDEVTNK